MPRGRRAASWASRLREGRTPDIDLTLPGLGLALGTGKDRLQLASGTRDETVYRRRVRLLKQLWADGDPHVHVPILRALIARDIRIADVERLWLADGEPGLIRLARSLRRVSLATVIDGFLASEDCPKKSRSKYEMHLHDFAAYVAKHVATNASVEVALDKAVLKAYLRQLTAKRGTRRPIGEPVSTSTRNRYRATLSGLCSYCVREGHLSAHPMVFGQVAILEEPHPRLPDLTPEEVGQYIAGVDSYGDEERSLAVRVLLHTGADVGEVLSRRVSHLVHDGPTLMIRFKREKVRKSPERLVPVPAYLAAMLRGWIAAHRLSPRSLLFPTLTDRKIEKAHDYGVVACGHPDLTRKDLRHLAAQAWRWAGVDLQTIQGWLGHASIKQTAIYTAYAKLPDHQHALIEAAATLRPGNPDISPDMAKSESAAARPARARKSLSAQ